MKRCTRNYENNEGNYEHIEKFRTMSTSQVRLINQLYKDKSESDSRSSSTESDSKNRKEKRKKKKFDPKFSILSQLAPELTQTLQNKTRVTLAGFENICKLFIKDNLNSKSIDKIYSCKPGTSLGFDEAAENLRGDITRMDQGKFFFLQKS